MMNRNNSRKKLFLEHQKVFEILFVLLCGVLFFSWSVAKELNFAPDEFMRYQIPDYIYRTGRLPNGNMEELRNDMWGFSYAFYPNFLGPLLSAAFMKVTSIFTVESSSLLIAARFTSVLSGVITVWSTLKIGDRLFSVQTKWIMAAMLAMIPEFVFLTSYVNNDIICICGSALICLAWVYGLQDGWDYRNCLLLAIGIVIVALSYYNGYGWILCSIILFCLSYVIKDDRNVRYILMLKYGGFISVIVIACIGYFFVRNAILYNGDFLGMNSLNEASEQYALDYLKPSNRYIAKNIGMSVWEMLTGHTWSEENWIQKTYKSFIGVFGYWEYFFPKWIYSFFSVIWCVGGLGIVGQLTSYFRKKREISVQKRKKSILFYTCVTVSLIIPVMLSIYYSYAVDCQPQGRYCYPMIVAFVVLWGNGINICINIFKSNILKNILTGVFCLLMAIIIIFVSYTVYFPAV